MPPFYELKSAISGFKERIESLSVQGDRVIFGTVTGNLFIYSVNPTGEENERATLVTNKNLGRRSIEQVEYIKDINSVVLLSDALVTLYPLPDLVPPTPLPQTRSAFSFAVHSSVERILPDGKVQSFEEAASVKSTGVPTVITYLAVGCRRKLVIYSWRDGEAQDIKEAVLPHSPRTITFLKPNVMCFAYTATEHVLFYMETMTTSELTISTAPVLASTSLGNIGRGALTGLGGYMTRGLTAKAKPLIENIGNDEVLVPKDNGALIVSVDGKARFADIDWPAPPDDISFTRPYLLAILPAGTVPNPAEPDSIIHAPVIQILSMITNLSVQQLTLPFNVAHTVVAQHTLRLLTSSPGSKTPLFAVSTPTDRNAAANEGSTLWVLGMHPWGEQVDELVDAESYEDALALLDTIDKAVLQDKGARQAKIRALNAVSQFKRGEYDTAINTFIELDINPAKVMALFPEAISGRLHVPQDDWITLFGGRPRTKQPAPKEPSAKGELSVSPRLAGIAALAMRKPPSPPGSVRSRFRAAAEAVRQGGGRDDDTASIRSRRGRSGGDFTRSVETLIRYLSDRRPQVTGALSAVHISPSQSHRFPFLSETSVEDLLSLPNAPLSSLTPEQLTRFAQIVDTALFKSYLVIRPALLGPLCRIDNWCEVSEVEEVLQEREKYTELIFLYHGKKMHKKALELLRRLSDKQSDKEEKLRPIVSYLQKLGPEFLDLIFEYSRWVYQYDADLAFEIFSSELTELPRSVVADFLEELDNKLCARYLEHLIQEREENSTLFHDRLADLYLDMTMTAKKRRNDEAYPEAYAKFLEFIEESGLYRTDRLFAALPTDSMFEARAILLGRLGRHDGALETYVYRLRDYSRAEEYCKSIYRPNSPTKDIFLILLKIYLQPSQKQAVDLLEPALALISRQSPRLDTIEALQLLPPLVTAAEVKNFLRDAVREPVFHTRVLKEIRKARSEQVDRKLMHLQSHRVKITDSRICPQCHKRLGNSVIAVHAPRGEVTHHYCREAFARTRGEHVHLSYTH